MVGAAAGMATLEGCDNAPGGNLCGPCGSVIEGEVSIAGNAQVDGFFAAVADLGQITGTVQADFEANIRALAEVWGYAELDASAAIDADVVAGLMAHIRGELMASVDGGVELVFVPAQCSANVSVAVEASAQCEAQAGCDVEVDPGEVSVSCEGTCSGSCSGSCSGGFKCEASAGIACSGSCSGSCDLSAGGGCEGTCNGDCAGSCSVVNADGSCAGRCDGMCTGSCELSAGGSCEGTCHGTCEADAEFDCNGEPPSCNGSCEGECSGSCQGEARPPSASAECEASANCEASASAQASANIECTPPSLDFRFNLAANLTGNAEAAVAARAEFEARLTALRVRGAAILQGFAQLSAIITGEVNGEVVFNPTPLARIQTGFTGVIDLAASGDLEIAPGRIACVIPALEEAAQILGSVATETGGTLAAQASFSTELFATFGG
ncbi:MAG: hypothetical protein KDK70_17840 [Myxococcales bacterium]|nr:hypothetical protein [Myxococcales bacterium]